VKAFLIFSEEKIDNHALALGQAHWVIFQNEAPMPQRASNSIQKFVDFVPKPKWYAQSDREVLQIQKSHV